MRKITLSDIKKIQLDMLNYFVRFCRQNNLSYSLVGGTLLGAIRHKGFIPWDDDIDICMPRHDYEFLINNFSNDKNFKIKSNLLGNLELPFAKIIDLNTVIDSQYDKLDANKHLWIDIFPVDGLPEALREVEKIYDNCNFYRKILMLSNAKLGEGTTIFRKYSKYILKPLAKLYGGKRCVEKIESIARQNQYSNSEYVGVVTWGLLGAGQRMLKSEFEKLVEVEFEGYKFAAFSCWDSYLKGMYGDYMKLPPKEQRKTHNMIVYLRNK